MKPIKLIISSLIFAVSFTLFSCGTTELVSWKNPTYLGPKFKNVFVVGIIKDLSDRKTLEEGIAKVFSKSGVNVTTSLSVLSPEQEYTYENVESILKEKNIDAILVVKVTGSKAVETYVPPTSTYYSYYSFFWRTWITERDAWPGGYVKTGDLIKIQSKLFANSDDKLIYTADTKSYDYQSASKLTSDLGKSLYEDMKDNGLFY